MSEPTAPLTSSLLSRLDEARVGRLQWKIMFVSGMGFFTDAYDLFVIGIVAALLKPEWHLATSQISLLNSVTLATSAIGAAVFGRVADIFGRKRIYGYEVLILAIGALASALAPGYLALLICRAVLGIGIGGDYPVSATIMSEYAGKRSRGAMVGLVFAMQGAGLLVGPLVASALLASGMPASISWRVLLALGAIPGLAVFYLRRRIRETPRFAMASGAAEEAEAAVAEATASPPGPAAGRVVLGTLPLPGPARPATPAAPPGVIRTATASQWQLLADGFRVLARNPRMLAWLAGTAGAWAMLDFAYYGNTISAPEILALVSPSASLLHNTLIQLAIFAVFAVPGYVVAICLLDRAGRKGIQLLGFAMMAVPFAIIGIFPQVSAAAAPFIAVYGVSYFFTEFGPNTTTFVYPAEIFPVTVRTTGHGVSAAAGKLGAFAGAYAFPAMLASGMGLRGSELVAAVICLGGLVLTAALLPEPKGRSLEELSEQAYTRRRAREAQGSLR